MSDRLTYDELAELVDTHVDALLTALEQPWLDELDKEPRHGLK